MNKRPKKILNILLSVLLLILIGYILFQTSWASYRRAGAFGCAGQCLHIVAGNFMLNHKSLYSDIFYNHQPIMATLSLLIQKYFQPVSLYHLILFHRLFIIGFSLLMNLLLILRFRWVGAGFVLFYEATKFYLFGNSFLPEALLVYPLVYLFALAWLRIKNLKFSKIDYLFSLLAGWLIFFSSFFFALVSLALLSIIIFLSKTSAKSKFILLVLFFFPILFVVNHLPLKDYLFDLLTVNQKIAFDEAKGTGMLGLGAIKAFFYPLFILTQGESNFFRLILVCLDLSFLASIVLMVIKFRKYKEVLFVLTVLGISLNRFIMPGKIYYESYYLLPWFGVFVFSIFLLLKNLFTLYPAKLQTQPRLILVFLSLVFVFLVSSPSWFVKDKTDIQTEFSTNYTHYYALGETIKELSDSNDSLFIDQWDELIFWQANRSSSYQYSLYTPIMASFPKFSESREKMFRSNPPVFYYSFCTKEILQENLLPDEVKDNYFQLSAEGEPTCLFVLKSKLDSISAKQWQEVKKFGFEKESSSGNQPKTSPVFLF